MSKERLRAFVFPGQGSQKIGMGENLVNHPDPQLSKIAKRTFEEASDLLQVDYSEICFKDPNKLLNFTRITQPALLITSISALRMLNHQDVYPDIVAGHSMGEYSALVAANKLSFEQALRLVKARGEYMEEAGEINPGKMAAILKLSVEQVQEICEETLVSIANYNSPEQHVISGESENVLFAVSRVKEKQGKAVVLPISIASHCVLMEPAKEKMIPELDKTDFMESDIDVVANVSADLVFTAEEIRRSLANQMTGSVRWTESIKYIREKGADLFIEVGPGEVLSNLIKRIDQSAITNCAEKVLFENKVLYEPVNDHYASANLLSE